MTSRILACLVGLALTLCRAHATFSLVEDFNSLTLGPINSQHGWTGTGTADGRVVLDPVGSGSQVLAVTNTAGCVYHALGGLSISNQNNGTLFFRLLWPGTAAHAYVGLSDVTAPAVATTDYETYVGANDPTAPSILSVRDATKYTPLTTLQSNTWYKIWIVPRNSNDLFAVYIQGGSFATQTQLTDSTNQTWFTFRGTSGDGFNTNTAPYSTNDLITFAVKSGSSHVGPYYVDDVFVDPTNQNLANPLDVSPPVMSAVVPQSGTSVATLTAVTVVFSESVTGVAANNLLVNGASATNVSGSGTTWTWQFPQPAPGTVTMAWAVSQNITDLSLNRFAGTYLWSYTLLAPDFVPPYVSAVSPLRNATVSTLTQVTVTFSEPVTGLQLDDLLVNDTACTAVASASNTYTFTCVQPAQGSVSLRFDPAHGITDISGNRLDETASTNQWSYTVVDTTPPTVALLTPAAGSTVSRLGSVEIYFSEPVTGVDASDLLVNGLGATNVTGSAVGPYVFSFPQPALGTVSFSWKAGHGIKDLSAQANSFGGGAWFVSLLTTNVAGQAIINEFLTANISTSGLLDEDGELNDWIELFNPGAATVDLAGWSLTDDAGQLGKWVFPPYSLYPGQYLVVFASGKDRRPPGGASPFHTSFTLSPYGNYLALCPPDYPRLPAVGFSPAYPEQRNDYSYGLNPQGQWSYYATPTPGYANGDSYVTNSLDLVHFSMGHGLFSTPFQLVLTPPVPGALIRFTIDGSVPTEFNGTVYTAPITVSTTTTLRAAAFQAGSLPSKVATATYVFPEAVLTQPSYPPGFPITSTWTTGTGYGFVSDYGVTPSVVYDPLYNATLTNDLLAIPTLSIVMDVEDIFGAANGIYTHAEYLGPLWERACSVELINPDGSKGFQVDAGIQMHGGGSRSRAMKHPFRLQFKGKYGPTKLQYPFFADTPVQEFDGIDLRSEYNDHWTHGGDASQRARGTLVRDAWFKDVHRAMGSLEAHGNYVHLYINGLYWGVYNTCERPDGGFGAAHLGGAKDDYDAYNGTGTQLVGGTAAAHTAMLTIGNLQILSQYELMKQYLDVTQYANYMLLHIYGANQDWGISKNWAAFRKREAGAGFKYVCWDDERIMEGAGQLPMGVSSVANLNSISPDNLQAKLVASPEYRLLFADLVQKHFFNGGVLTSNALVASWNARAAQIDRAIVGESARWGAAMTTVGAPGSSVLAPLPYPSYLAGYPYTRDANWLGEQGRLFTNYFPVREPIVLNQLRSVGLYPTNVMAPAFNQFGGGVVPGFGLTMTATNTIYYTSNGTDPRVYGSGAVAASARRYTNGVPVAIGATTLVKARGLSGTNWSGLVETTFLVQQRASPLRISEVMYNPSGGSTYEYLELLNSGAVSVDIDNYSFDGIKFVFPPGSTIGGGERLVLANNGNPAQWATRYPGVTAAGWYSGSLDNAGERVALLDPNGETVFSVSYSPTNGWPVQANGRGYSLELTDNSSDANDPASWRASLAPNGTPGQLPGSSPASSIVLNEILAWNLSAVTNSGTLPDWVELCNTGSNSVNLVGYSLSDDGDSRKFVFPSTNLAAGAFLVVWCDVATNTTPGLHAGFGLNRKGGDLFLYDASTNCLDALGYGPQVADRSLGRLGAGWQLTTPTAGGTNLAAVTAATTNLVLNEWLANSPPGSDDWIELFNRATNPVALKGICLGTATATTQIRSYSFIAPGGWLQLPADKNPGPVHLDFKLSAEGGTNYLYDETGDLADSVVYGAQVEGISQGRLPDGSALITNFVYSASPGASNYIASYSGAVLNEICALNRTSITNSAGLTPDWVELYNPTASPVSLAGFALGRGPNFNSAWKFPAGAALGAYSYQVVWFDNSRPASTNLEVELTTGEPLSAGGDTVYFFNAQGLVIEKVAFGPQAPDFTVGRSGGIWQLLATPTPKGLNATPAALGDPIGLRFNEWLAAQGSGQTEFFELFNPSPFPVDLSGMFVSDDLSISGLTQFLIDPLSFIGPAGFTTFYADSQPSTGPDHVSFKLGVQGDSLRLYSATAGIIDTVVFGQQMAGSSEGRLPDGGYDIATYACATPGSSNGLSTLRFTTQPQNCLVPLNGATALYGSASGFGAVRYQWFHGSAPIALATNKTLAILGAQLADAGSYALVASNACGVVTSAVTQVTIVVPPQITGASYVGGGFQFAFAGPTNAVYTIEKSTNLVQWADLFSVTATNGTVVIRDPQPTNSRAGFYRARVGP